MGSGATADPKMPMGLDPKILGLDPKMLAGMDPKMLASMGIDPSLLDPKAMSGLAGLDPKAMSGLAGLDPKALMDPKALAGLDPSSSHNGVPKSSGASGSTVKAKPGTVAAAL